MPKSSRIHHGDEFGRQAQPTTLRGLDAPMIGAASTILVDGLTERESGQTPPPPPISVTKLAVIFGAMLVTGLVILFVVVPLVRP